MLLFLISLTLFFTACKSPNAVPDNQPERPVKVVVARHSTYLDKDYVGMSTPDDAVNLAFKVSGQVSFMDATQGRYVTKGHLLAAIDPRDVKLQVNADRAAYVEAQSKLNRMKRLLEHEAVSRQEYEEAQNQYIQAKSTYENSLDMLSETKLRAPFSGNVEYSSVDTYQRVQAGQTIVRLVNPVTTTVKFTVSESNLAVIANPMTRFFVTFDNYRGVVFDAKLKNYAKTSSESMGFPVALTLQDVNRDKYSISPGMSCSITVQSVDTLRGAVSLPLSAIYTPASGGEFVWVVGSDDRVEKRSVVTGEIFSTDKVLVRSGVEQGDVVVSAGVNQLRDGEKVRILK